MRALALRSTLANIGWKLATQHPVCARSLSFGSTEAASGSHGPIALVRRPSSPSRPGGIAQSSGQRKCPTPWSETLREVS
jgi:hypothetical protein